VGIEMWRD